MPIEPTAREQKIRENLDAGYQAYSDDTAWLLAELARLTQERDKWLDAFNRSEQFQDGPTRRAEQAEAERDEARRERDDLAEQLHEALLTIDAVAAARETLRAILHDAVGAPDDPLWIVQRELIDAAKSCLAASTQTEL